MSASKSQDVGEMFEPPKLQTKDFPVVVTWIVQQEVGGGKSDGCNLVHSQTALNELFLRLAEERQVHRSLVRIKLLHPEDLVSKAATERVCAFDPTHNPPGFKHQSFCHECGAPTTVVKIVDPSV